MILAAVITAFDKLKYSTISNLLENLSRKEYLVRCKKCRKIFSTRIDFSSKGADLDDLMKSTKLVCPNCHETAEYDHDDYTPM